MNNDIEVTRNLTATAKVAIRGLEEIQTIINKTLEEMGTLVGKASEHNKEELSKFGYEPQD